ncbi:MAG: polyamine aminopropyltransferase [Desulfurococcales archaeon]|nr:polyamine aminopropyltransferase [Desulfurococcales archaeon]
MAGPLWNWYVEWEFPWSGHLFHKKEVLCHCRSEYQDIEVAVLEPVGKALILDGKIQSALLDEHVYHEALVHPAMILHGSPRRVLILGGGEGATAREVLRFRTVESVVMVDIDRDVIEAAKRYLPEWHRGSFEDPRLRLVIMDGLRYVEEALGRGEKYDVIIADLADPTEGGPAYKLYVKEFYEKLKGLLAEGGVFVTQATSLSYDVTTHAVIRNTIASIFKYTASYSVFIKSFDDEWSFVLASDHKDPAALTPERVDEAVKELVIGENRFYDGESHRRMFSLPRYARDILAREKRIATLDNPVYVPV